MKKTPGKAASVKLAKISYGSFVDEFSESQQLYQRLNAIVLELHRTVKLLEQNLHKAHLSARAQRLTNQLAHSTEFIGKNSS
jgi:hypothetical protein